MEEEAAGAVARLPRVAPCPESTNGIEIATLRAGGPSAVPPGAALGVWGTMGDRFEAPRARGLGTGGAFATGATEVTHGRGGPSRPVSDSSERHADRLRATHTVGRWVSGRQPVTCCKTTEDALGIVPLRVARPRPCELILTDFYGRFLTDKVRSEPRRRTTRLLAADRKLHLRPVTAGDSGGAVRPSWNRGAQEGAAADASRDRCTVGTA